MSKIVEQKYFEKLNISTISIDKIKELIEENIINTMACWDKDIDVEKQTFHIIGPAGVGKTQICKQIADNISSITNKVFNTIIIKSPVLSRDDLLSPFPYDVNGKKVFKMLYSEFIPTDINSFGIFVIDECNRGDHNLQQLMWQVQNEYAIHLTDFPKGWFVIALDNPDDQEYSMNTLYDAAGLRRCLHLYVDLSVEAFLKYAKEKNFHSYVIDFIQIHPEFLYDFDSQKIGSVYANPASWERVSNILKGYDSTTGIKNNLFKIDILLSGLLNTSMSRMFIEYVRDNDDIDPKDIFNNYNRIRHIILEHVKNYNNAKLSKIINSFVTYMLVNKPDFENVKCLNGVGIFFSDIPADIAALFVRKMDTLDKGGKDFLYFASLHVALLKSSESYKIKFYENIAKLGNKAKNGN